MAELSTIARPYAHGLIQALKDRSAGAEDMARCLESLDALVGTVRNPQVAVLVGDPKLTDDQLFDLIVDVTGKLPEEVAHLLRVVVENGLEAMPEIARQFRELKNLSEGVADAVIETAFELSETEVQDLLDSLGKKFPGVKLHPIVVVKPELIGGVCVRVGDQVLDASIRARLAQMKTTLTA